MKDTTIEKIVEKHINDIKELYVEKNVFGGQKVCKITFKDAKPDKVVGFTPEHKKEEVK